MPNIHKSILGARLPLSLLVCLRKLAERRGMTVTALVQQILTDELDKLGIEKDDKDEEWIQERTRFNETRRSSAH